MSLSDPREMDQSKDYSAYAIAAGASSDWRPTLGHAAVRAPQAVFAMPTPNSMSKAPIVIGHVASGVVIFDLESFVAGVHESAHRVVASAPWGSRQLDSTSILAAMSGAASGPIVSAETVAEGPHANCVLVVVAVLAIDGMRSASLVQNGWPGPLQIVFYSKHRKSGNSKWAAAGKSLYTQAHELRSSDALSDAKLSENVTLRFPSTGPPSFWPKPAGRIDRTAALRLRLRPTNDSLLLSAPLRPPMLYSTQMDPHARRDDSFISTIDQRVSRISARSDVALQLPAAYPELRETMREVPGPGGGYLTLLPSYGVPVQYRPSPPSSVLPFLNAASAAYIGGQHPGGLSAPTSTLMPPPSLTYYQPSPSPPTTGTGVWGDAEDALLSLPSDSSLLLVPPGLAPERAAAPPSVRDTDNVVRADSERSVALAASHPMFMSSGVHTVAGGAVARTDIRAAVPSVSQALGMAWYDPR